MILVKILVGSGVIGISGWGLFLSALVFLGSDWGVGLWSSLWCSVGCGVCLWWVGGGGVGVWGVGLEDIIVRSELRVGLHPCVTSAAFFRASCFHSSFTHVC